MKIIWCDNFDRETVSERLVADNIQSLREGELMLEALTKTCTETGSNWYRLEPDDYVLYKWEP